MAQDPVDISLQDLEKSHSPETSLAINISARYIPSATEFTAWQYDLFESFLPNKRVSFPPENAAYKTIFLKPTRNRLESKYLLALSHHLLTDGGTLITAQDNQIGSKTYEKDLAQIFSSYTVESKHKCRLLTATKTQNEKDIAQNWLSECGIQALPDQPDWFSCPGLFAWDHLDKASSFLIDHLPQDAKGIWADFGCGSGFLSAALLDKNPDLTDLYAIDFDRRAIDVIGKNIADTRLKPLWRSVPKLPASTLPTLDGIIMNPPFHTGRADEPDLGLAFITKAHETLKKGGTIHLVANQHLPYEKLLHVLFGNGEKIIEDQGFKILRAVK